MSLVRQQREMIENGPRRPQLCRPCTLGDGITDRQEWTHWPMKEDLGSVLFFIPASGSASRLWSDVHDWQNGDEYAQAKVLRMAELPQLKGALHLDNVETADLEDLIRQLHQKGWIDAPKGSIPFHRVAGEGIAPFAAHMFQLAQLPCSHRIVHYTLNERFLDQVKESILPFQRQTGVDLELSTQDKATDSIVFDLNLLPLMDEQGEPLTRPSGHGALLPNIQDLDADLIFVKNVDNVLHPDKSKVQTRYISQVLGLLAAMVESRNEYLKGAIGLDELHPSLLAVLPSREEGQVKEFLDRPVRVCGMVRNVGKPGGGPFWTRSKRGDESVQIVEQSQIDDSDMLDAATHFNPVFMGLHIRKVDGSKYDLERYSAKDEYMVVTKPHEGRSVCFVERPGLWNGGMSDWLTVFVEVPAETCTQVKTILDLGGPEHQPD